MHRLRPYHLALCVLLVGWTPSFLLAYYSYTVLGRAVESKIIADARALAGSLSRHVENELTRTGETLDYYRTLPTTVSLMQPGTAAAIPVAPALPVNPTLPAAARRHATGAPGGMNGRTTTTIGAPTPPVATPTPAPSTADLLASIFYPRRRLDGLFLTDTDARLIAALPPASTGDRAREFDAPWRLGATQSKAPFYVSPVYARPADGRLVTSVIVAVHDKAGGILGFLGADLLVERLGKRLRAVQMDNDMHTAVQVIDGSGRALFGNDFEVRPATEVDGISAAMRHAIKTKKNGVREENGQIYFFAGIESTDWTIMLARPAALVHQPVEDLLRRTAFIVGWLVVGVAALAFAISTFYRRQLLSSLRMERAQIFNEKILANMPVGIALVEPAGEGFLQVNSAFTEIIRSLGHLPRDLYVDRATFAQVAIASREALARVLHFGVPYQAIEQRVPTASGQTRYLTTNLLRLQDSQQRTLGVLCLVEDTTQAVTLRQELINANSAKDQFLAQLSHELRNPLSPVITMVAELESLSETVPEARQPLEIIRRNVELEARLIDDLLDVTRISSGKLQLNRRVTDVRRTLRLALEICQRDIDDKKLHVEVDFRAREHWAEADPARLQQIFWNLIKNAVKFTPEERRITVRAANQAEGAARLRAGETHVAFATPGKASESTAPGLAPAANAEGTGAAGTSIRLDFIDEGIGIEPQHLRRIFNAFDQGQSNITQRFGGLGLGLAISKAMVEAHGGTLTASSEGVGKGATFTVELATCATPAPTAEPPNAQPAAAASPLPTNGHAPALPTADGQGRRVLLVDDHHDTCLGMQRLLGRRGYDVTVAHTVADGLAKAKDGAAFDLLISDIGLPDGTGYELMESLRGRGGPPGIALSGYGMESDLSRSEQAGFSEHLIKPVTIDRLEAAIHRLLPPAVAS